MNKRKVLQKVDFWIEITNFFTTQKINNGKIM